MKTRILKSTIALFVITFVFVMTSCDNSDSVGPAPHPDPTHVLEKYLGHDIFAVTEVYGPNSDSVTVFFYQNDVKIGAVQLDPSGLELYDRTFRLDLQYLTVYALQLNPPNQFVPGQVHIDCEFSNYYGEDPIIFTGLISAWTY